MLAYNTSKAAVVNFTRTLAGEWGKYNINVNALAPGMFPSKMTKGTIERIGAQSLAGHAPLLRIGDDDDLKGAALLFASQAGKHITGQILAGGRRRVGDHRGLNGAPTSHEVPFAALRGSAVGLGAARRPAGAPTLTRSFAAPREGAAGLGASLAAGRDAAAIMKFQIRIPFVEELGFELLRFESGEAEIAVALREVLTNSWGVAHGGVTMTLLDVTMRAAPARAAGASGVADLVGRGDGGDEDELSAAWRRAGLLGKGKRLHRTASLAFCEGSVFAEDGTLVAHATGTFKYLNAACR